MLRAITAISDGLAELFELQSRDDFEKLLAAETNSLRTLQLRRLLNNQTDEEVDRLLATIEDELATDPGEVFAIDHDILARGEGPGPSTQRMTGRPSSMPLKRRHHHAAHTLDNAEAAGGRRLR